MGKEKGQRTLVSENGGAGVAEVGVDELTGDDLMAVECLAVSEVGVGLAGVRGGVEPMKYSGKVRNKLGTVIEDVPAVFCELGLCKLF